MSDEDVFKEIIQTKFFVLIGSLSDLSKIDFSLLNIQCLDITSEKIKQFCKDATHPDWTNRTEDILEEINKEVLDRERLYVLLPIDLSKEYKEDDFFLCLNVLLLLFPSDLAIKNIIDFQVFDDKFLNWTSCESYNFYPTGYDDHFENYLFYHEDNLEEINSFVSLFVERINSIKYLKTVLNAYISSFHERNPIMGYLSLCISTESINNAPTELNYRIGRNISILIGDSKSRAETIFDNLKLIYDMRSRIVHGGKYDIEKVIEYLPYLRSVVSRMIIEIVLLNIQDIDELNRKLTFAGFGDKNSFSTEYRKMTLNITSYVDAFRKKLRK
jgi:Apea-like HEPN